MLKAMMQSWGLWRRPEVIVEEKPADLLTLVQLVTIMPRATSRDRAAIFLPHLNAGMHKYAINQPQRMAAFLANAAHESGELRYMVELWGPTPAQKGYEGRIDLGNTEPGDGELFKGRGIFQITGRANYATYSRLRFGNDRLLKEPELLSEPEHACDSACWFWNTRGLNEIADAGDFRTVVRKINGGYNGITERTMYYERALRVL